MSSQPGAWVDVPEAPLLHFGTGLFFLAQAAVLGGAAATLRAGRPLRLRSAARPA